MADVTRDQIQALWQKLSERQNDLFDCVDAIESEEIRRDIAKLQQNYEALYQQWRSQSTDTQVKPS